MTRRSPPGLLGPMVELGAISIVSMVPEAVIGLVFVEGAHNREGGPALDRALAEAVSAAKAIGPEDPKVGAVRKLLKHGKYRATGRGKPAHEYLLKAALEDRFPRVGALVDVLNLVSLGELVPISLIDVDRAPSKRFTVRRGRAGESFVFNASGQTIELEDLLLVASDDTPIANPVKDSLQTKLTPESSAALAVVYGGQDEAAAVGRAVLRLAEGFRSLAGAARTETGSIH